MSDNIGLHLNRPTNPYSASKSATENICISYENTYKLPIIISNVMNAFGERQHVEKYPKGHQGGYRGEMRGYPLR